MSNNIWGLDYDILEEAYFGSKPEFKEIERLLGVVIDRVNGAFGPYSGNALDWLDMEFDIKDLRIYSDGTVANLERLFCKAFGLKEFHLDFYYNSFVIADLLMGSKHPGAMGRNAFTIPQGFALFDKGTNPENSMIRPTENIKAGVLVGVDLIWTLQLTPRELMSCILHELGHNLDASIFTVLAHVPLIVEGKLVKPSEFAIFTGARFLVTSVPFAAWMADINKEFDKIIEHNTSVGPFLAKLSIGINTIKQSKRLFGWIRKPASVLKYIFSCTPKEFLLNVLNPRNLFGYGAEKFADSFATAYGYGPENATFMRKVQLRNESIVFKTVAEVPVLNFMADFVLTCRDFVRMCTDPHPHAAVRIYRQLAKLKKDLKDPSLNPKIRQELESNIEEMQKYIDDVILNPNHEDNKKNFCTFVMNWVIIKVFDGKIDPRELYDSREL